MGHGNNQMLKDLRTIYNTTKLFFSFLNNPRTVWRAGKGFINVNLLGRDQIRFVEIFVTLACNAKCDFCSNGLFTSKKATISKEKYIGLIDECAALNVPTVALIGGEPLLYKHINELISRINSHGMMSAIATNGSLLTREKVRELADCGLSAFTISFFSLDPKKHDQILKLDGTYDQIMKARDYCTEFGVRYSLATVMGHSDFENGNFDQLIEWAEREKIFMNVNPLIPTGYAKDQIDNLLILEDVEKLNNTSKKSTYISTHLTNNYFGFGCPAGNAYLGINATGEIFPCFFVPVSMGNVNEISLREAWEKARNMPLFKRKHKMCYAGVSREFIKDYLLPIYENEKVPAPVEEHPIYDARCKGFPDLKHSGLEAATKVQVN